MSDRADLKITRRELLAGAGATVGVAAPLHELAANSSTQWDRETDVVIVGGGAAGCTAAFAAASNNAHVTLLDKAPILGGTSRKSGGATWIPNNFLLRSQGIEDSKADCLRYMSRFAYPELYTPAGPTFGLESLPYKLLEAFYDHGALMIDRLRNAGVMDFEQHTLGPGGPPSPDYAEHLPENKVPAGRALASLDSTGHSMRGGRGSRIIDSIESWLIARGSTILTAHRVVQLIMQDGRCVGVEAESAGKRFKIRARRGVIFSTGGYAHNPELLRRHQTFVYGSCAVPQATGDFLDIAAAVGARSGAMHTAWRTQVVLEEALQNPVLARAVYLVPADSMLLVNKRGRRVVNEKRNYNDRSRIHYVFDPTGAEFPNQLLFMVFDSRARDRYAGSYPIPPVDETGYLIQGQTFTELARNISARLDTLREHIGVSAPAPDFATTLSNSVSRFNEFASSGRDLDFNRGLNKYDRDWQGYFSVVRQGSGDDSVAPPNPTMRPLSGQGPYYAIILSAGVLDTSGGPLIDERARVLGVNDKPIPGLFGAGNCIASPTREAYLGGGATIGLAMTFGYIAGMNAAMNESGRE